LQYKSTIRACFAGYVVQAVVNNFVPLLFLTFQSQYGIPLSQVTLLITINFALQLAVDGVSVFFIDRIGYRAAAVIAHICAALGLVGLAFLPDLLPSPFAGLLLSVLLYALGGGLLEVIVSPIVESCPSDHKAQTMSILHSFYCWGSAGVIVISTLFLKIFGASSWKILAAIWALLPLANCFVFTKVPLAPLVAEGGTGMHIGQLFRSRVFWVIMLMMLCAGASEQAVSQWASTFAEKGLGVSKAVGDLTGPTVFALLMATSRLLYGKFGAKIDLNKAMMASALLCVVSYLLIGLTNSPVLGLVGVGLCGLAVGIFWPGTFSTAAASLRGGGTAMFALMALAGDLGCSGGPTLAGAIAGAFGDNLRLGILCAVAFPALMILGILLIRRTDAKV
jgi:fucose permease